MSSLNYGKQTSYENGYPMSQEYYTYYPTWFNGIQQTIPRQTPTVNGGLVEDVVISGVSGRFQGVRDVEEYAQKMYNGVQGEQTRRWEQNGTLRGEMNKMELDSELFGVNGRLFETMDKQMKSLVEVTYEAMFDAGLNPIEMRGTRTGVFVGTYEQEGRQMLSTKLSTLFDLRGPTQTINTKSSSSLIALDAAINAIRSGLIDYAIVAGLNGEEQQAYGQELRGENVVAILIQKKSLSKRFYAKVLHSRVARDVRGQEQGDVEVQSRLLREIYAESDIDPALVTYIETHGNARRHLNTISEVFASPRVQRTVPLFVGSSTQTKVGHQEPVSGIFALVKMLISIQRGMIPANLEYQEPSQEVAALLDGRLKVVNSNTKFYGGLMALNSLSFDGVNAHILLQPNNDYIMRRLGSQSFWNQDLTELSTQPRLFQFGARTQQGLEQILEYVKRNPTDLATHFLVQPNSSSSTYTHPFRGFTVLNGERDIQEIQEVRNQQQRPVWYVFSGIGSQWQGMGQDMMKIQSFRESIIRSDETLRQYGLNVTDLIYAKQNVLSRPTNALVAIAAIQIALVDTLKRAGIEAQGMIGQSVGELGCAYADHTLTADEVLKVAYYRGRSIEEAQLVKGSMAVVGLTYEQAQRRLPSGVVIASRDGQERVTVSGPKRDIVDLIEQLNREGVFTQELDSSEVAFHSQHMTQVAPSLRLALENLIRTPKQRSSRWISTSVPEQKWNTESARYSSADYHVNTLTNPVYLQQALKFVPTNAIVIEIGPQGLLQEVLRRELSQQTVVLPIMRKHGNQLEHFWAQLGRIYNQGVNVNSVNMFVPYGREHTVYPVPVGTRFLSQLAKWNYQSQQQQQQQQRVFDDEVQTVKYTIDLLNDDAYLNGHSIQGRVVYPVSGYLHLIWKTLAKMHGYEQVEQLPIAFENVEFHRETVIVGGEQDKVVFTVTIKPTSGLFELVEGQNVVVSGRVYVPVERQQEQFRTPFVGAQQQQQQQSVEELKQQEIYKELRTRGFEFQGEFQPIIRTDVEGRRGELAWTGKWAPFVEGMLQMNVLGQKGQLVMPKHIRSLIINPRVHLEQQWGLFEDSNKNYLQQGLFEGRQSEQQTIERLVQWQERFQQQQVQHQRLVQRLLAQPQLTVKQMRLLGELEQLNTQPQQWYVQQQWTGEQQTQRVYERLQQQLRQHQQQQKIFQQIWRQVQQGTEQQEVIEELKQVIQEQQHFELEVRIVEQNLIQNFENVQRKLRQMQRLVQRLYETIYQVQDRQEQRTLFQELEQTIQEQIVYIEGRKIHNEKRQQLLKSWEQQLTQQQFTIQQILRQHQVQGRLRQTVVELDDIIAQKIEKLSEREIVEKQMRSFYLINQQYLRKQQEVLLSLIQSRVTPTVEEKRQVLVEIEQFFQEVQQQLVKDELKMKQNLEINTRSQYQLEQLVELVEQYEQEYQTQRYHSKQQQYGNEEVRELLEELRQIHRQKQQMRQQLFWNLQQQRQTGERQQYAYQQHNEFQHGQKQQQYRRDVYQQYQGQYGQWSGLDNQQERYESQYQYGQQQPQQYRQAQGQYRNQQQQGVFEVIYNQELNRIVCGGIEIVGIQTRPVFEQTRRNVLGQPRLYFSPLKTYIVSGELNHAGLFELVQLIVERGARYVVLSFKNGSQMMNEYQTRKLRQIQEEFGVQVRVLPYDAREVEQFVQLVDEAVQMGSEKIIGGIFHFDGQYGFENNQREVRQTGLFDKLNRLEKLVNDLTYFVVIRSNEHQQRQQQQQEFANRLIQEIFERRQQQGKHALKLRLEDLVIEIRPQETVGKFQTVLTKIANEIQRQFNVRKFEQLLEESVYEPKTVNRTRIHIRQQTPEQQYFEDNYQQNERREQRQEQRYEDIYQQLRQQREVQNWQQQQQQQGERREQRREQRYEEVFQQLQQLRSEEQQQQLGQRRDQRREQRYEEVFQQLQQLRSEEQQQQQQPGQRREQRYEDLYQLIQQLRLEEEQQQPGQRCDQRREQRYEDLCQQLQQLRSEEQQQQLCQRRDQRGEQRYEDLCQQLQQLRSEEQQQQQQPGQRREQRYEDLYQQIQQLRLEEEEQQQQGQRREQRKEQRLEELCQQLQQNHQQQQRYENILQQLQERREQFWQQQQQQQQQQRRSQSVQEFTQQVQQQQQRREQQEKSLVETVGRLFGLKELRNVRCENTPLVELSYGSN